MRRFPFGCILLSVFVCLDLPFGQALAEEITLQAQVDKTEAALGEKIAFSIAISGSFEGFPEVRLPELKGFAVASSGQSQQIQFKKGQASQSLVLSYVLVPTAVGKLTIGPARVKYGSKVYETQPIEIKVTEGAAEPPAPQLEGGITL